MLRVFRHHFVAAVAEMKQDGAALEYRDVAVGQPGYLTERLVEVVLGLTLFEGVPLTR